MTAPVRALPTGNGIEIFRASMAAARGALTIVESRTPLGGGTPPNVDHELEAIFVVRIGKYAFRLSDRAIELGSGGFACVPRGTTHAFTNIGPTPGHLLIRLSSGSLRDAEFADIGAPDCDPNVRMTPSGPPEIAGLGARAARRGVGALAGAAPGR